MSLTRPTSDLITFLPGTFKTVGGQSILGTGDISADGSISSYTRKTSAYTAVSLDRIIADTSGGTFTITLPALPAAGNVVSIVDGGNWNTNNLTVARNGSTIEGAASNLSLTIAGSSTDFIYDGTTWQVFIQADAVTSGTVTNTGSATLSNKSIALGSNTVTGTLAQFNNAVTDADFASIAGVETLTNKTLTGVKETKVTLSDSIIDTNAGTFFTKTIGVATTFTVTNIPATGTTVSFILDLTNGGSSTITWWANVKWAGGTVPTLTAAGRDVLGFFTHDGGTTWTGLLLGKDVK